MLRGNRIVKKIILIPLLALLLFTYSCGTVNDFSKFDGEKIILSKDEHLNIELKELSSFDELDIKKNNGDSFVLFVYNSRCEACYTFKLVLQAFIEERSLVIYSLENSKIEKNSSLEKHAKLVPTVFIYHKGKIIAQLNPNDNEHLDYFRDVEGFSKWFDIYIKE